MSQPWKIAAVPLAFALLDAGCADPGQDASPGATGGGATSVSAASSSTGGASSSEASSASTGQPPGDPVEVDCRAAGDGKTTLAFVNRCDQPLQFLGSLIEGGELGPGRFACRDVGTSEEPLSSLRYWAYAGSDPGGGRHTLAEMTLVQHQPRGRAQPPPGDRARRTAGLPDAVVSREPARAVPGGGPLRGRERRDDLLREPRPGRSHEPRGRVLRRAMQGCLFLVGGRPGVDGRLRGGRLRHRVLPLTWRLAFARPGA
ncbi:uncharacterized protein SOCE836_034230 [Sorangium cellulosum]|uniref:Uncharacterized protein n=1 Tax=Sorangium cellulosum TaxID=56 RepID=A0A4P2QMI7_SORCE|nr:uncharacterized protein SOCE836_034230 [Sorangium cellulosum]